MKLRTRTSSADHMTGKIKTWIYYFDQNLIRPKAFPSGSFLDFTNVYSQRLSHLLCDSLEVKLFEEFGNKARLTQYLITSNVNFGIPLVGTHSSINTGKIWDLIVTVAYVTWDSVVGLTTASGTLEVVGELSCSNVIKQCWRESLKLWSDDSSWHMKNVLQYSAWHTVQISNLGLSI